ncbi:MAG TPA: metallophosphoesterase [Pyrinomonadaceae bacterium]|nr:metallophosphoesterase [Pyrinomonadaceae bacterium]
MGRTIVVGDIHGCYDELMELCEKVGLNADDRVVAVGDLIVKGEKNREVLELFMSDPRFTSVIGNHDLALLRRWRGDEVKLKKAQKAARRELKDGQERYAAYLASLPYVLDLGSHLVVHAGLRPGVALDAQKEEDLTELRGLDGKHPRSRKGRPWYKVYEGPQTVLFGHWPAPEPRRGPYALGLDTGCVYGHRLTAYVLETSELVSVPARRVYEAPGREFA